MEKKHIDLHSNNTQGFIQRRILGEGGGGEGLRLSGEAKKLLRGGGMKHALPGKFFNSRARNTISYTRHELC